MINTFISYPIIEQLNVVVTTARSIIVRNDFVLIGIVFRPEHQLGLQNFKFYNNLYFLSTNTGPSRPSQETASQCIEWGPG